MTPAGPLTLIHQDPWLLAVHKPAGLLVHRSALDAHADDDLVTRLRQQLDAPVWPAHRLDKGTSGVLLLARDAHTAGLLGAAFAEGRTSKHYLALVRGWPGAPGASGLIEQPLARDPELPSAGQPRLEASTRWQVLQQLDWPLATHAQHAGTRVALMAVQPLTGRRHQIRRHFKHIGHPLIGDATHGKGPLNRAIAAWLGHGRLWLHACQLELTHPVSGQPLRLQAAPGPEWARLQSDSGSTPAPGP
ncbi:pseudouridine synthase [Aquabacterium sp. OR-4]|uniref:pseudouridine synthase n=1 Tax=Aquabacterium sp. OR-4 TaxID=2978127 RepID=UPI0021B1A4A1|nr:pseudouridine synthase [Aquabacterium sp. OR-4]MDT7836255.1 pseudouridine synthase [Aquabacterium sp. OR-4]